MNVAVPVANRGANRLLVTSVVAVALAVVLFAAGHHRAAALVAVCSAAGLAAARAAVSRVLRERTAELSVLAESMPVGVFRAAADGAWTYTNPRLAEMIGIVAAPPEAVRKALLSAVHPDDRARVLDPSTAHALRSEDGFEIEYRVVRPDQEVRHLVMRTSRCCDAAGQLLWYQGVVSDVTARRVAAQAVAVSEAEFRGLAMSVPFGISRRNRDGRITFVNREMLSILGLAPDTPADRITPEVFHPADREAVVAAMQRTLATQQPYELEARVLRPDGSIREVELSANVHLEAGGTFSGYLLVMSDVTDQRAAARAAQREEQRLGELMATLPAGVLRMDAEGRWIYVNERFRQLWHMSPEQDPGSVDWTTGLHEDDRERVAADWGAAVAVDGVYEGEFRIMAPDGSSRWVWTRASSEYDEEGLRTGFLATTLDVHERHEAQAASSRSARLYETTVNSMPGVLIGLYDLDLRCVFMEGEATTDQLNTANCAGKTLAQFGNQATADAVEPGMREALRGREQTYGYRSPRDDSYRENHVGPLRGEEGEIEGVLIVSRDVTALRASEDARKAADEHFRIAFEHAPIGFVTMTLAGRFEQVNGSLCQMTGYDAQELCAMPALALVHPEDIGTVQRELARLTEERDTVTIEHRISTTFGSTLWVDARVTLIRDERGEPTQLLGQMQDITERRSHDEQLRHLADHDPLTSLLNRRGLDREIAAQLARVRRYDSGGALLALDLDGFKHVNDTLGHAAGDKVIVDVAAILRSRLRETDVIARLGGDEFAVILPSESLSEAGIVAEALVLAIREHANPVTASIGVAPCDAALTAEELLARADLAMYDAKAAGRDRYALWPGDDQGDHARDRAAAAADR